MCGIFGIINKDKKLLDKRAFLTLGVDNDSRGGDACGIFIDGKVEYGTNAELKYFSNFYETSELLSKKISCNVAFGHCRKASIGGALPELAQPCIIKNNNGEIQFVVLHNGTITNYKELAKKYIPNIDITNMSDSQVMTNIFYYAGYDVLAEYNGGAVFVIADYRGKTPTVYMFKGCSKKDELSKEPEEERPLYFTQTKDSIIFSSLPDYLFTLFYKYKVYYVISNYLIKYDRYKNDFIKVKKYDRSDKTQISSIPSYGCYGVYGSSKSSYYDGYPKVKEENLWGNIDNCYEEDTDVETQKLDTEILSNANLSSCHLVFNFDTMHYELKMYGSSLSRVPNGVFHLDQYGNILEDKDVRGYDSCFIEGVLIKNKAIYEYLKKSLSITGMSMHQLTVSFPEIINYCSAVPYIDEDEHLDKLIYKYDMKSQLYRIASGTFAVPFSNYCLTIENGVVTDKSNKLIRGKSCYESGFEVFKSAENDEVPDDLINYIE